MEQDNNIITASIEAESVSAHTKEKKVSGFKKRFGKKKRKSATQINESNNGVNQIDGTYEAAGEGDVTTDASASVDTKKSFRKKSSKAKKAFNIYRDNTGDGSNNTAKQGESFMRGIKTKLIITSLLPTVVGVIIVLIVAVINITQGMNEQAVNGLTLLGESTKASYENAYMGDWRVDNNGNMFKGDTNLSQKQDGIDKYITDNDADLAVFIGVDCKLTSLKDSNNKRMLSLGTAFTTSTSASVLTSELDLTVLSVLEADFCSTALIVSAMAVSCATFCASIFLVLFPLCKSSPSMASLASDASISASGLGEWA